MAERPEVGSVIPSAARTEVFVDGFNFIWSLKRCFDGEDPTERAFWLPGLTTMLCDRSAFPAPVNSDIHFFIGRLSESAIAKDTHAFWANKIREIREAGMDVHLGPKVSRERLFQCPNCGNSVATKCDSCGQDLKEEKPTQRGIATMLAIAALESALLRGTTHFILFAQDREYLPLVQALHVNVKERNNQAARIATAYPVCQREKHLMGNVHVALPSTLGLGFTHDEFATSLTIAKPPRTHSRRRRCP